MTGEIRHDTNYITRTNLGYSIVVGLHKLRCFSIVTFFLSPLYAHVNGFAGL